MGYAEKSIEEILRDQENAIGECRDRLRRFERDLMEAEAATAALRLRFKGDSVCPVENQPE